MKLFTGMPRVDCLFDDSYLKASKNKLLAKYPILKDKKIILYAPTFRGNIYQGFSMLPFDGEKLINSFDENKIRKRATVFAVAFFME